MRLPICVVSSIPIGSAIPIVSAILTCSEILYSILCIHRILVLITILENIFTLPLHFENNEQMITDNIQPFSFAPYLVTICVYCNIYCVCNCYV